MKKILINFLIFLVPFMAFASSENLIKAIKSNDISAVKSEISAGAELDKKFNIADIDEETTPLMLASYYGYFDIVKLLVENGADVFARDSILDSALTLAQSRGHDDVVNYLLPYFRDSKYDFFDASDEIEWSHSWKDAVERSKAEKKYIMAVFMRIGCKWSKKMGESTFQDELIIRSMNKWFVPVLLDKEIDEYPRDKIEIKYTPTIFFVNGDCGETKCKIFGFRDPEKFIKELKEVEERRKKKKEDK